MIFLYSWGNLLYNKARVKLSNSLPSFNSFPTLVKVANDCTFPISSIVSK